VPVVFWHGLTPPGGVSLWPCGKLPGTTETNVAVRVRRRIVQVQSEDAGVGSVVPIAAALEGQHRRYSRHRPSPARQIIAPFGDYASSGTDDFTNDKI